MGITKLSKSGFTSASYQKYDDFLAGNTAFSPSSYESIASATGTGSSATITFSSIPSTYSHLQIRALSQDTNTNNFAGSYDVRFNSDTGANYAYHQIYGDGASVASVAGSSTIYINLANASSRSGTPSTFEVPYMNAGNSTGDTFSSLELYIPNYSVAGVKKAASLTYASERNDTTAYINAMALLVGNANTSAVGRIQIDAGSGYFIAGSSFYLYGISNS